MIEVETFLRRVDGDFVRVQDASFKPPDPDYIEGAIRLLIEGTEVIGLREWDYVDQLWCYIADLIAKLRSLDSVETYLPDQPIRLAFDIMGSRILVTVDNGSEVRKASASLVDFLRALKNAGTIFFDKMSELAPGNSYAEARRMLSA